MFIFSLAGASAVLIPMGPRFRPRIMARCNWIVTEPSKALKLLARHQKNRFTSGASFLSEHPSGKAARPSSQEIGPASSPAHARTRPPPKD
jgi:hypothetical protein